MNPPARSPTSEQLALGLDEVARSASLSRRMVEQLVARGDLPSLKVGRRRLVRAEALARWLEERERTHT